MKIKDDIYNLLTEEVMNDEVTKNIIDRNENGQQMFEGFVTERLTERNFSAWDKIKKEKLGTFKGANATKEVRVGDKMVQSKKNEDYCRGSSSFQEDCQSLI